jgi:phosphatidylglycerol:prolipoprotein diacylglycerol transferase
MHPVLLEFGYHRLPLLGEVHLYVPTYGFMLALGVVVAWVVWMRMLRSERIPTDRAGDLGFWTLIAGLAGAKLVMYVVEWRDYVADPRLFLETLRSAGAIWGGVIAGVAVLLWLARRFGLPAGRLLDTMAVPVPLAQAIGRMGCFLAGCCWGRSCTRPWAVTFGAAGEENTGVPAGVPLHPVQLYESAALLLIAAVAFAVHRRPGRRPGESILTYLLLYSVARIVVETFRDDPGRGVFLRDLVAGGISTGQIMSALVAVAAVAALVAIRRTAAAGSEPR